MKERFLILAGPADAVSASAASIKCVAATAGLLLRHSGEALQVYANESLPHLEIAGDRGVLLGRLFAGDGDPVDSLAPLSAAIVATGGAALLRNNWGSYLIAIEDSIMSRVVLLRDPSGGVPAYRIEVDDAEIFVSDIDLACALKTVRLDLDEAFPRHWLGFPFLRTSRTAFRQVRELLPGERATVDGSVEAVWRPWPFAAPDKAFDDFDQAVAAVRSAVLAAAAALAAAPGPLLLELSGGLDSSVIAAALTRVGRPFSAANLVTGTPDGDERRFARAVAERSGCALTELTVDPTADVLAPVSPRFRPGLDPVLRNIDEAFLIEARRTGAHVLVSGGGGDNVFSYLTSAAPVVDAWRSGSARQALKTCTDVATLTGSPFWTVLSAATRLSRRGSRAWRRDETFLRPGVAPEKPDSHPWLEAPPATLPGNRAQVEAIVRIQHFLDTFERWHAIGMAYPLLAQPVIETCLRVPSWMWCAGGLNRAVARAAFADLLPPAVTERRTKGRLEAFALQAFDHHRPRLKSLLLEGSLAARGLIDRHAVETYLAQAGRPKDDLHFRLFEIANLELFLASWR